MLCSCTEHTYEVKYKIHYPDTAEVMTITTSGVYTPKVHSFRGSNTLVGGNGVLLETTAPIELISVKKIK